MDGLCLHILKIAGTSQNNSSKLSIEGLLWFQLLLWALFFAHSNDIGYLLRRLNPSLRSCTWMEERYARLSSCSGISLPVICS